MLTAVPAEGCAALRVISNQLSSIAALLSVYVTAVWPPVCGSIRPHGVLCSTSWQALPCSALLWGSGEQGIIKGLVGIPLVAGIDDAHTVSCQCLSGWSGHGQKQRAHEPQLSSQPRTSMTR